MLELVNQGLQKLELALLLFDFKLNFVLDFAVDLALVSVVGRGVGVPHQSFEDKAFLPFFPDVVGGVHSRGEKLFLLESGVPPVEEAALQVRPGFGLHEVGVDGFKSLNL